MFLSFLVTVPLAKEVRKKETCDIYLDHQTEGTYNSFLYLQKVDVQDKWVLVMHILQLSPKELLTIRNLLHNTAVF